MPQGQIPCLGMGSAEDARPVKPARPECTPRCEGVFFGGSFANGLVPAAIGSQFSARVSQLMGPLFAVGCVSPKGKSGRLSAE